MGSSCQPRRRKPGRQNPDGREIPGVYKDIDVVMHDARELVEIRHTLRQIVNVKGD
jgi:tRNA-splicing ligase RtcB